MDKRKIISWKEEKWILSVGLSSMTFELHEPLHLEPGRVYEVMARRYNFYIIGSCSTALHYFWNLRAQENKTILFSTVFVFFFLRLIFVQISKKKKKYNNWGEKTWSMFTYLTIIPRYWRCIVVIIYQATKWKLP